MKLRDFGWLTDENIDPDVVSHLRSVGLDVADVCERGLHGRTDIDLLRIGSAESRLVVTHDADFGTLAVRGGEPIVGIIFLRPGHIDSSFTTGTIDALLAADPDVEPPFIVVARRSGNNLKIRMRRLLT